MNHWHNLNCASLKYLIQLNSFGPFGFVLFCLVLLVCFFVFVFFNYWWVEVLMMPACISTAQGINVTVLAEGQVLPHTISCWDLILSTIHPIRLLYASTYCDSNMQTILQSSQITLDKCFSFTWFSFNLVMDNNGLSMIIIILLRFWCKIIY